MDGVCAHPIHKAAQLFPLFGQSHGEAEEAEVQPRSNHACCPSCKRNCTTAVVPAPQNSKPGCFGRRTVGLSATRVLMGARRLEVMSFRLILP